MATGVPELKTLLGTQRVNHALRSTKSFNTIAKQKTHENITKDMARLKLETKNKMNGGSELKKKMHLIFVRLQYRKRP